MVAVVDREEKLMSLQSRLTRNGKYKGSAAIHTAWVSNSRMNQGNAPQVLTSSYYD